MRHWELKLNNTSYNNKKMEDLEISTLKPAKHCGDKLKKT